MFRRFLANSTLLYAGGSGLWSSSGVFEYIEKLASTKHVAQAYLPRNIPDLMTHKLVSNFMKTKEDFGSDSNLPAFEEIF